MTLSFENSRGEMLLIAGIDDSSSKDEIIGAATDEIEKFCKERQFPIPYIRTWNVEYDSILMTKFDVGSHSEFFYLNPAIDIEHKGEY